VSPKGRCRCWKAQRAAAGRSGVRRAGGDALGAGQSDPQDLLRRGEPELAAEATNWWRFMTERSRPSRSLQIRQSLSGRRCDGHPPGRVAVLHRGRGMAAGNFRWGRRLAAGSRPCLAIWPCCRFVRQFRWPTGPASTTSPGWPCSTGLERFLASESFSAGDGPANCAGALPVLLPPGTGR